MAIRVAEELLDLVSQQLLPLTLLERHREWDFMLHSLQGQGGSLQIRGPCSLVWLQIVGLTSFRADPMAPHREDVKMVCITCTLGRGLPTHSTNPCVVSTAPSLTAQCVSLLLSMLRCCFGVQLFKQSETDSSILGMPTQK